MPGTPGSLPNLDSDPWYADRPAWRRFFSNLDRTLDKLNRGFGLFGNKPTPGPRPQPNWPPARQTYPAAWSQPGRGRVPVPAATPRPGIGARAVGPGIAAASAGLNIAAGQSPVDATLSAAGSLILGGIGARLGGKGGQVTGSTIGAGLPQALDWLGQHAVLSDRGALKPSSIRVGSIPPTDQRGESYRDAELRLSAAARAAGGPSAGGGIGGGNAASFIPYVGSGASSSPAAERAYRQEVSSVAQQAAQNPELQRYEKDRAAAAASKDQGRMDAARDLGMQIWAQKYGKPGDLASRVKPGQSGYDVIQRTLGAGQMGSPMNFGFDDSSPLATTPPVAAPSYAGATPASLPGTTPLPSNAFSGMVTTPYDRFNAGQTLTSAPLGMPGAQILGTYEGATGIQGMGASLGTTPSMFNPSDEKAKALLEAFKNKQFGVQK